MPVISARHLRTRKPHACASCDKPIRRGASAVRMYGAADTNDPPYVLYVHAECASISHDAKVRAAFDTALSVGRRGTRGRAMLRETMDSGQSPPPDPGSPPRAAD